MQRRQFLTTAAAVTTSMIGGIPAASAFPGLYAAGEEKKYRVGLIGSGWYGKCDLLRLIQVSPVEVVGLCDVDSQMLQEAADIVSQRQLSRKKPAMWSDYRKMLAEEQFDIVLVDTPDHWHALPTIDAVSRGIDVWVQKPISVDIIEGQAMLTAARKHGRVVQVGTQRRSTPHLIEARDRVVREGLLGRIGMVEICCYYHMRAQQNPPDSAPPKHLDFEMWTGPAPMMPYNSLIHPRGWRAFMEYGNGIVGDMCIHMYDMVRWMLNLGWPSTVSSSGGILVQKGSRANISDTQTATFQHPDFPVIWQHRSWGDAPDPEYPWAAIIYGENGTLKLSVNKYDFIPRGQGQRLHGEPLFEYDKYPEDETEKDLERHVASAIRGHMRNFLECIESRQKPVADIEEGHISTTSCILANLSMQLGRSFAWDPATHTIVNDAEANKYLRRPYREPWIHPEPV
ncbi:MAG: Gfo/Idh/MocA family oxidoreductase [Planctomyces sp.]|nr:Gfo/Idh/MocA family oxidoreductase [Planctomyces sp.]